MCLRSSVDVKCEWTYVDVEVAAEGGTAICAFNRAFENSGDCEEDSMTCDEMAWEMAREDEAPDFECLCLRFLCVEGGGGEDLRLVLDMAHCEG